MVSKAQIEAYYLAKNLDAESRAYIKTHAKRFSFLISFFLQIREKFSENQLKIMDIGPSFFTEILQVNNRNDLIYTLGFSHASSRGGHFPDFIQIDEEKFFAFDLNNAAFRDKWITPPPIDIVVMGEVLEHLHTSPIQVFKFIKSFLKKDGFLIVGTPNAVALQRRLSMLAGNNPYELIRENRANPGHFREYTLNELIGLAQEAGLQFYHAELHNYFQRATVKGKLIDALTGLVLPNSFKSGINIVFKNC